MNEKRTEKCFQQVEHIKGVFRTEAIEIFRTEAVIRGRADNLMVIRKIIKRRAMVDAILHRKLMINQYEPH